jgi:hypothetical protein
MYKKRREVSRLYITFVMLNMMKVIKTTSLRGGTTKQSL